PVRRPRSELGGSAHIVQQGRRQHEVRAQPRMELCRLAAERRNADGVLEEAAGVAVMAAWRGRQGAESGTDLDVGHERLNRLLQAGMVDLGREELEESVQLVRVTPQSRREVGRVRVRRRLERADLQLELVAEALDAAEDAHRVTLGETRV